MRITGSLQGNVAYSTPLKPSFSSTENKTVQNPTDTKMEKLMNVKILPKGSPKATDKANVKNLIIKCITIGLAVTVAWFVGITKFPKLMEKLKANKAQKKLSSVIA